MNPNLGPLILSLAGRPGAEAKDCQNIGTIMAQVFDEMTDVTTKEFRAELKRLTEIGKLETIEVNDPGWRLLYRRTQAAEGDVSEMAKTKTINRGAARVGSPARDKRIPKTGSVIKRTYRGSEIEVIVADNGFKFQGAEFPSLTAVAKVVTGYKQINGVAFFGLAGSKTGAIKKVANGPEKTKAKGKAPRVGKAKKS